MIDPIYARDPGDIKVIVASQQSTSARVLAERRRNRMRATRAANKKVAAKQQAMEYAAKYTPDTQPRDEVGRYKKILARLKLNLGPESTMDLAKEIESAEAAQIAGDYTKMRDAGANIVDRIERIEDGSLPKGRKENLRDGARELGELMAYLPMPQGDSAAKVRFSDLPPAAKDFVRDMVEQAIDRLGAAEAEEYVHDLQAFMSGGMRMDADTMASNLNKLMKILH